MLLIRSSEFVLDLCPIRIPDTVGQSLLLACFTVIYPSVYLIGGKDSGGIKTGYLTAGYKYGPNRDPGDKEKRKKFKNFYRF